MSDEKILLVDLCKLVEEKMYELGYTKGAVDRYKKAWAKLQEFSTDKYFNEQVSAEFLKEYCKIEIENLDVKVPKSQLYIFRCVRVLSEYKRFKTFFRKWRVTAPLIVWPEKYAEAMDAYFVFIRNCQKITCYSIGEIE